MRVSDKSKLIYLVLMLIFLLIAGTFWLDFLGLIDLNKYYQKHLTTEEDRVLYADDDEPSLIKMEEFKKEQALLQERISELDKREAQLIELQKELQKEKDTLEEMKSGLDLEKKKFEQEKTEYSGYKKNVLDLADKISNMPPEDSVAIMVNWEDPLIIDVLRQMDQNANDAGTTSITSYLISLMPKDKASRIMYLMTQL